jgi:hypothetical protein
MKILYQTLHIYASFAENLDSAHLLLNINQLEGLPIDSDFIFPQKNKDVTRFFTKNMFFKRFKGFLRAKPLKTCTQPMLKVVIESY